MPLSCGANFGPFLRSSLKDTARSLVSSEERRTSHHHLGTLGSPALPLPLNVLDGCLNRVTEYHSYALHQSPRRYQKLGCGSRWSRLRFLIRWKLHSPAMSAVHILSSVQLATELFSNHQSRSGGMVFTLGEFLSKARSGTLCPESNRMLRSLVSSRILMGSLVSFIKQGTPEC